MDWNVLLEKTLGGSDKAKLLGQFMSLIYIIKRNDKEIVFKIVFGYCFNSLRNCTSKDYDRRNFNHACKGHKMFPEKPPFFFFQVTNHFQWLLNMLLIFMAHPRNDHKCSKTKRKMKKKKRKQANTSRQNYIFHFLAVLEMGRVFSVWNSPGCSRIHFVDQNGLNLTETYHSNLSIFAFPVLGLKICVTSHHLKECFLIR